MLQRLLAGNLHNMPQIKGAGIAAYQRYYKNYRIGAERRGLELALSLDSFIAIAIMDCFYCGSPPRTCNPFANIKRYSAWATDRQWVKFNGIDRVDNLTGYTAENSIACCTVCNSMKSALSKNEFLIHIKRITEFQGLK